MTNMNRWISVGMVLIFATACATNKRMIGPGHPDYPEDMYEEITTTEKDGTVIVVKKPGEAILVEENVCRGGIGAVSDGVLGKCDSLADQERKRALAELTRSRAEVQQSCAAINNAVAKRIESGADLGNLPDLLAARGCEPNNRAIYAKTGGGYRETQSSHVRDGRRSSSSNRTWDLFR